MLKHIFPISIALFLAIAIFAGCQPAEYTDTIEFRLPDTNDEAVASYIVDLIKEASRVRLKSCTGRHHLGAGAG